MIFNEQCTILICKVGHCAIYLYYKYIYIYKCIKIMRMIEFTFNNLGATAIAHVKGNTLQKITFPVKLPKRFYNSFLNEATEFFYEKYPTIK